MKVRRVLALLAVASLMATLASAPAAEAQVDQAALIAQIRDAIEARGGGHFVTPVPGSRSGIIAVDTSSSLFFFLERGSIRGSAIDEFYSAYDVGDMDGAYSAFLGNAIMMIRATDYGWNGVGVPMTTASGSEIDDILFKDVGGTFGRAAEITDEDVAEIVGMLETVLAALEAQS